MKYIRTKNGITPEGVYQVINCDDIYGLESIMLVCGHNITLDSENHCYCISKNDKNILKKADTIEELCDDFVWQGMVFDRIENNCLIEPSYEELETSIDKEMIEQGIYGAIWTDKGLIYVAKMNEKGELELL